MTRETKIGLLFGLAVIIVFAVLLSHTGTVPPPGAGAPPVLANKGPVNTPVLDGTRYHEISPPPAADREASVPETRPELEPRVRHNDALVDAGSLTDGLPAPISLEMPHSMELADAAHLRGMEASLELPATILGTTQRKAPALPEPVPAPQPTVRTDPPVSSARPADNATAELAHDQPSKTAPPIKTAPPKEYVVQKKDTMTTIAEKYYGSSSPRFVDILVKSNQGRVKNANTVIEGQKLLIPNLPPEMFENAPGFDVSSQAPLASMDEMLNGARRAPKASVTPAGAAGTASGISAPPRGARPGTGVAASPAQGVKLNADPSRVPDLADLVPVLANPTAPKSTAKPSAAKDKAAKSSSASAPAAKDAKSEKPKSKDAKPDRAPRLAGDPSKALVDKDGQMYRWYEVKRNDTLANIARQELGSAERWNEIRKLNGAVDPKKIKPGERIRLPRKPQSTARESGRASA